ncbi:MAG: PQQ-binding-like beta-propeller repeat protein [Anaerosomatales bacterium]|nr:PQQ-binding-like beta-propeller repeat protein [Anaerosomatales bacterium]
MRRSRVLWAVLALGAVVAAGGYLGLRVMDVSAPGAARVVRPDIDRSVLETVTVTLPAPLGPDPYADGIKVATFLGDHTRAYYGEPPVPERLELIWRARIGGGTTGGTASSNGGMVTWYGTGWTGQPALVRVDGRLQVVIGGFDHNLRRIDAETGDTIWTYEMDDVIKGSPTVFTMPGTGKLAVVCGSRRGFPRGMGDPSIAPVRCVDFETGEELWRLPVPRTRSYSRDADGSPLLVGDVLYVPVESGYVYAVDPTTTEAWNGHRVPKILAERLLLGDERASSHGGNLVLESSPSIIGDTLYVNSGAGHVYGLRMPDLEVVWDFFIGSDMDGSPAVTAENHLLIPVEQQYIRGKGGVFELDPAKDPEDAVVWYFPTGSRAFADWQGGVIGSATVNDAYNPGGRLPSLVAFSAIDGNVYVVSRHDRAEKSVAGPDGTGSLPSPLLVFKDGIGGAISTPIIFRDHLVAAGYDARVHVYRITYSTDQMAEGVLVHNAAGTPYRVDIEEVATFTGGGTYESTPLVWQGRIYIGARDGWFYCIGDPDYTRPTPPEVP